MVIEMEQSGEEPGGQESSVGAEVPRKSPDLETADLQGAAVRSWAENRHLLKVSILNG